MAWEIDKVHSEVGFAVKHMMISTVRGKFHEFDAKVELDPAALESSKVVATIDAASIDTRDQQRDGHLRSADFLDVEKHPKLVFESKNVRRKGKQIEIEGELTIRDTTRPLVLSGDLEGPLKDPWGATRMGFSLSGELNREDFGLKWNQVLEAGGVLVGQKVKLQVEIEVVQK